MKMKYILPAGLLALLAVACQKEIDWGTGNLTPSQRLIRIKSKSGTTDSTQVDYSYDASGRLIREKTIGVAGGTSADNDLLINRNSTGVIVSSVQKSAALVLLGVDSIVTRFNFNSGTSRYTSSVFATTIMGFTVNDSAVYSYDAGGRISSDAHYLQTTGLPIPLPPVLALKNNYYYSSNGAKLDSVMQEAVSAPGGPLSPVASQKYTYDAKLSPLVIVNEAILLNRTGLYSSNNPTKTVVSNTISPGNDFTLDNVYIYNSSNTPDSLYSTRSPGGTMTASRYFYQ